jgi:hypothetical protein
MPEELPDPRRWWRRGDGTIWMVNDPDHVRRILADGWQEVAGPTGDVPLAAAEGSVSDEPITPPELMAGAGEASPKAKPIRKAVTPGESEEA